MDPQKQGKGGRAVSLETAAHNEANPLCDHAGRCDTMQPREQWLGTIHLGKWPARRPRSQGACRDIVVCAYTTPNKHTHTHTHNTHTHIDTSTHHKRSNTETLKQHTRRQGHVHRPKSSSLRSGQRRGEQRPTITRTAHTHTHTHSPWLRPSLWRNHRSLGNSLQVQIRSGFRFTLTSLATTKKVKRTS
jgi:hypothetical protein